MGAAYLSDAIGAAVGAQAPIFERGDRRRRDLFHPAALRDQAEQAELVVEPVERRLGAWRAARFIIDDGKAAVGIAVDAVGLAVKGDAVGHDLAAHLDAQRRPPLGLADLRRRPAPRREMRRAPD